MLDFDWRAVVRSKRGQARRQPHYIVAPSGQLQHTAAAAIEVLACHWDKFQKKIAHRRGAQAVDDDTLVTTGAEVSDYAESSHCIYQNPSGRRVSTFLRWW